MTTTPIEPTTSDLAEALNPTLDRYGIPAVYDNGLETEEALDHLSIIEIDDDEIDPATDDEILAILAEQTYARLIPAASLHGAV